MIILKSIREYKKQTFLAPFFMTLEVFTEILIPIQMAKIIDIGLKNQDLGAVKRTGLILLTLAMVSLILGMLSGVTTSKAGSGFAKNLRKDIFYKIQDFSFKNMDKFKISSLITRMTTDITNVQMAFMLSIRLFIRTVLMISLSLYMTYRINHKIGTVFVVIASILALVLLALILRVYPLYEKAYKEYDEFNKNVRENINGIRVVKAFVREDYEISKFQKISLSVFNLFKKAGGYMALNTFIMQFTIYLIITIILIMGGKFIVFGSMKTGELTSVIVYAMQILFAIMALSFVFVMLLISRASVKRITEVLTENPEMIDKENSISIVKDGSISFKNVNFSYSGKNDNLVLKNINLEIKSGQTVGIIGATGAAKSSLVHLIPRLYDVTSGSIEVGGINVKDYKLHTLRDEVSMVLQKNVLFKGTIFENVRWGDKNATDEEVIRVCKLAQADSFIQSFPDKYETLISQGGNNVSGGQKQRLCIARALLKKPKILILDDSTSAVDTKTDFLIRKAFKEEIPNTTKIIISQRVSSIEDADLIVVMENGEINGLGTHEELINNNKIYREIAESQKKGAEVNE